MQFSEPRHRRPAAARTSNAPTTATSCSYKLQGVLKTLGYAGIVVLVDRVDEPHLINGSVERMRALVWSMLDNKFLKQPGIGLKLLLPIELADFIETRRPRLLPAGPARQAEHDPVARMDRRGAVRPGQRPRRSLRRRRRNSRTLRDLFDDSITDERLIDAFAAPARAAAPVQVPLPPARGPLPAARRHAARSGRSSPSTFETQLTLPPRPRSRRPRPGALTRKFS